MSVSLRSIQTLVRENGIQALSYYFSLGLVDSQVEAMAKGEKEVIDITKAEQKTITEMAQFFLFIAVVCNYNHDKSYNAARRALRNIDADNLIISQEYRCLWGAVLHLLDTGASVITVGVIAHVLSNPDIELLISYRNRKALVASLTERIHIADKLLGLQILDQYLVNPSGIEISVDTLVEHCRQTAKQFLNDGYIQTLQSLHKKNASATQFQDVIGNYRKDLARVASSGDNSGHLFDAEQYSQRKLNNEVMADLAFPVKELSKWLSGGKHTHYGLSPLTVICGSSGTGKTTMALNLALDYVMDGKRVLFLTNEQSTDYIMDIFGTILLSIPYVQVRYGDEKQTKSYLNKLNSHERIGDFMPMMGEAGSDGWGDIARIEDVCSYYLPDVIVVDNLNRYKGERSSRDQLFSNHVALANHLQKHALNSLREYGKNIYSLVLAQATKTFDIEQVRYSPIQFIAGGRPVYDAADRLLFVVYDVKTKQSQLLSAKAREGGVVGISTYYDVHENRVLWSWNRD